MGMYIEGLDKQVQKGTESITVTFWDKDELIINEYDIGDMSKVTDLDLVRCGECKYYDTESRTFPCCTDIFGAVRYMEADGFCSKGERRTDEEKP